jgi:hypothetical protein
MKLSQINFRNVTKIQERIMLTQLKLMKTQLIELGKGLGVKCFKIRHNHFCYFTL